MPSDFRRLTGKILSFSPLFLSVVLLNYTVDPFNLFNPLTDKLVSAFMNGFNVAGASVASDVERLVEKSYIEKESHAPDIVVFGSSRSKEIRSDVFPGRQFFNHSVSAGSLKDFTAFYGYYRKRGFFPKKVILSIDSWHFNKNNGLIEWKAVSDGYDWAASGKNRMPAQFRLLELVAKKSAELLSLSYFQISLKHLRKYKSESMYKRRKYTLTKETYNENSTLLSDGSGVPDRLQREMSIEASNQNAYDFMINGNLERYHSKFTDIDPDLRAEFEYLVKIMKEDGVEVVFYLPPYHPYVYQAFKSRHFDVIYLVELYLRQYAGREGLKLYGSYNPSMLPLTEADFYDAVHTRGHRGCFNRIFAQI